MVNNLIEDYNDFAEKEGHEMVILDDLENEVNENQTNDNVELTEIKAEEKDESAKEEKKEVSGLGFIIQCLLLVYRKKKVLIT